MDDVNGTISDAFRVVINEEEQYSIWPASRDMPLGWKAAGPAGTKDECLDWIEKEWKDIRPLSLRKALGKA
jgi:MbtH protein